MKKTETDYEELIRGLKQLFSDQLIKKDKHIKELKDIIRKKGEKQ